MHAFFVLKFVGYLGSVLVNKRTVHSGAVAGGGSVAQAVGFGNM